MRRFENYRVASKLDLEDEMYAMWEKVDDIINSFRLSDDNRNLYAMIRDRFETYFMMKKRNIVFD